MDEDTWSDDDDDDDDDLVFHVPSNITDVISRPSKGDNERLYDKKSNIQLWAEFYLQPDLNPGPHNQKLRALNTQATGHFIHEVVLL